MIEAVPPVAALQSDSVPALPLSAGQRESSTAHSIGRLLSGEDFARVLRSRRLGASRHFELFGADCGAVGARLGLAISKRTAPTAVLRNLAKRIARESARAAVGLISRDYVVRSRSALNGDWTKAKLEKRTSAFKRELRTELDGMFARASMGEAEK